MIPLGAGKPVIGTEEAARYLGMSISWLNKSRMSGTGPKFIRIGGRIRYSYDDLNAFLEEQKRRSTSQAV